MRLEIRNLPDHRSVPVGFGAKFEPRLTGDLHFSKQTELTVGFVDLHAPEVKRAAGQRSLRIGSPAPHADASNHQIDKPTNSPEPIPEIPTVASANLANRGEGLLRRKLQPDDFLIAQHIAIGIENYPWCTPPGIGPAGLCAGMVLVHQSALDSAEDSHWPDRERAARVRRLHDARGANAFNKATPNGGVNRRDQSKPSARQSRC